MTRALNARCILGDVEGEADNMNRALKHVVYEWLCNEG